MSENDKITPEVGIKLLWKGLSLIGLSDKIIIFRKYRVSFDNKLDRTENEICVDRRDFSCNGFKLFNSSDIIRTLSEDCMFGMALGMALKLPQDL